MALSLIFVMGCQPNRPPAALAVPAASFAQEYFAGTMLSGPTTRPVLSLAPADSQSVHVTFIATEEIPMTNFTPVGSRAIFFSSSRAAGAVLSAAQLTRDASIVDLNDPADAPALLRNGHAGRITIMKTMTGALPAGVTGKFTVMDTPEIHDLVTGTIKHRSVQVSVSRPTNSDAPQLSLVMKDLVPRDATHLELLTETAIFNLPQTDQTTTLLVVPFQFQASIAKGLAILVHVAPGSADAEHLAAITQCVDALAKSSTAQPAITTGDASDWAAVSSAIQSLTLAKGRRESLAFLAAQTGGSICEDLAMEADDATLDQLVKKIQTSVSDDPNIEPNVGWILDHAALTLLDKLATDAANGTKVPTELLAILTNHTGEVGRHPSSLDEVLKGLTTRKDLDNRLLAQNMIYLEDSSPASRVRAYDWLSARHVAPDGYDPLASGKARRAALEKALGD